MYQVYELLNLHGTVEYVGVTKNPKRRMYQHTKTKPHGKTGGRFYGRQDLIMNIVKQFDNIKEANLFEGELKLFWGLPWTENENRIKSGVSRRKIKKPKVKIYENGVSHPGFKARKILLQYDTNNQLIKEWKSATDASNTLNINLSNISSAALGNCNTAGGYVWKYKKQSHSLSTT
jgi:predicted GIY-YIG superfamily endonuclease